jgi:hypothetical protein
LGVLGEIRYTRHVAMRQTLSSRAVAIFATMGRRDSAMAAGETSRSCTCLHCPPLAVGAFRASSCPAMALRLVKRQIAPLAPTAPTRLQRGPVPKSLPPRLGGRQEPPDALRDRLALVFGNGRPPAAKAIDVYSLHSDAAAAASFGLPVTNVAPLAEPSSFAHLH